MESAKKRVETIENLFSNKNDSNIKKNKNNLHLNRGGKNFSGNLYRNRKRENDGEEGSR